MAGFRDDRSPPGAIVEHGKATLVPDRVRGRNVTRGVERRQLVGRQLPTDRTDVLHQLLLVTGANDDGRDRRPPQQPVQRDLRNAASGLCRDGVQAFHDPEQPLLVEMRSRAGNVARAGAGLRWLVATDLARQLAPTEWAPNDGAHALVEPER